MVLRQQRVSPQREPSLAMGWRGSLMPRCWDVQRDSWYSGVHICTPQCCEHVESLVGVQGKEGLLPSWSQALQPISQNFGLGWKEKNGWWIGMANSWYRIGNQALTSSVWLFSCLSPWWPTLFSGLVWSSLCLVFNGTLVFETYSLQVKKAIFFPTRNI